MNYTPILKEMISKRDYWETEKGKNHKKKLHDKCVVTNFFKHQRSLKDLSIDELRILIKELKKEYYKRTQ